jgi:hypothetical protein
MSDQPEEELLTLHVQVAGLPGSPRIPLRVPRGITSAALRRQVCGAASVPPPAMRLIYRGRMIPDSEAELAVPEYKLEDGSVLHCMGKPVPKEQPKEEEQQPPVSGLPSLAPSTSSDPGAAAALAAASPSGDRLSVAEALRQLRHSNSAEAYAAGVRTLDKVLGNIVRHPMEERYRAIKAGNPAFRSRLGGLDGAGALLRACGFDLAEAGAGGDGTQHEEQWVMQASAESWPVLLENKAAVEAAAAAAEGGAPAAAAAAAAASSSSSSGHPASASDPLGSALSDPAMLLQALQVRFCGRGPRFLCRAPFSRSAFSAGLTPSHDPVLPVKHDTSKTIVAAVFSPCCVPRHRTRASSAS